ncbi:MAG: ATP-binding protein [Pseudomonadota bacterium]|jgi:two-component system nitrogen regulation sensor histidine kinase NtrY
MAFHSSFRANVVLRVAALAALLFALLWSLLHTRWDAVPVVAAVLFVLLLVELVCYVEAGTRDLSELLRSVAAGDFTAALPRRSRRPPFSDYAQASRVLIQAYRRLDLQRAASDELLRAVVEHVGVAVLCFTTAGRVVFANAHARALLGDPAGGRIDAFAAVDARLPGALLALADGDRRQLEAALRGEPTTLLLDARRFTLLGTQYTVVVLHDIREELESRDVQAWQAMTRVLTHEMMNSLTPIVTLSGHLKDRLAGQARGSRGGEGDGAAADGSFAGDMLDPGDVAASMEVIHERSSGLARFIQAYRQFANPPAPTPEVVPARELLEHAARLKGPELAAQGIALEVVAGSPEDRAWVDPRQVEQVLINLLKNAQQALAGNPSGRIELRSARDAQGRVLLHVTDNGPGIPPRLLGQVFVPFFTTHRGGTGVGLALSRQLARLNRGTLMVSSRPGHCCFTLRLPAAP